MSIYIISNRHVVAKNKFSNNGKENALPTFRVAECKVTNNKKVTYEIKEDIDEPDYNKIFEVIQGNKTIDSLGGTEYLFYDLYKSMSNDVKPHSDVLFFIHGYATTHEDELAHILRLKKLYIDPAESPIEHLIYLSWPTSNNMALTYWSDKEDSIVTGQNLARIYVKLNKFFFTMFKKYEQDNCKQKIHIMAHSMGNQVLKQMLGSLNEKYIVPFIGEIILVHADVSSNSFEKNEPYTKLHKLGQRIHIYMHKSDDALTISSTTKNFSKRLGKVGPSNINELAQSIYVIDVTNISYDLIDKAGFFSKIKERLMDHWGYMSSSLLVNDIIKTLNGEDERRIKNRLRHDIYPNYFYLNSKDIVNTI